MMPRPSLPSTKARPAPATRPKLAVNASDLALMLQIDYLKGNNNLFLRRLQKALEDAFRQGMRKSY